MLNIQIVEPDSLDQANGYFAVVCQNRVWFNGRSKDIVLKMFDKCQGGNKKIYVMSSSDDLLDLEHALKKAV